MSRANQPIGERCLDCANFVKQTYPLTDWPAVILNYSSSDSYKQQLDEAYAIWKGERKRTWFDTSVAERVLSGYRLEHKVDFYSLGDFQQRFGMSAKEASMPIHSLTSESGAEITGVIVDKEQSGPRVLTLFSEAVVSCDKHVLQEEFRPGQGKEVASWYKSQNSLSGYMTEMAVLQKIEEIKKAAAKKEEQMKLQAATAAEPVSSQAQSLEELGEEREDRVSATPFDSVNANKRSKQAKGADKSRTRAGAASAGSKATPVRRTIDDSVSVAGSWAGKSVGGASKASKEDAQTKLAKYTSELKLWDIMNAESERTKGQVLWQAGTSLSAWRKARPTSPETILLSSLYGLARKANQLPPDVVGKLSAHQRNVILDEISEKCSTIPPQLQTTLLHLCSKELVLTAEEAVDTFASMVFPINAEEPEKKDFDYRRPRLSTSGLSEDQKASVMQLMLTDFLTSLILQGPKGSILILHATKTLLVHIRQALETGSFKVMMSAALEDAKTMCVALEIVLGVGPAKEGLEALEDLATSSGGSKFLVYEARSQMKGHPLASSLLVMSCNTEETPSNYFWLKFVGLGHIRLSSLTADHSGRCLPSSSIIRIMGYENLCVIENRCCDETGVLMSPQDSAELHCLV